MPGESTKGPERKPDKVVRVIDSKNNTKVLSTDRGFPNKGDDMSNVPPSPNNVADLYLK
jgi:hypothetical protein